MALETTIVNREADFTAARGVTGDTRIESKSAGEAEYTIANAREELDQFCRRLGAMRTAFADQAPFPVPWRPGPFVPLVFTTLVDGRIRYGDEDLVASRSA